MDNTCVCCGAEIPEGQMVCWACEHGAQSSVNRKRDRCSTCKYRGTKYNGRYSCDYAYLTGRTRGCPGDETCDRYEKGGKMKPRSLGPVPATAEAQAAFAARLYNADKRRRMWAYRESLRKMKER